MGKDESRIAHQVFDDTKNASDEDNGAREVENANMLSPWYLSRGRQSRRDQMDTIMENDCRDYENPEEEDLDEETCNNDLLPSMQQFKSPCCLYASAHGLHEE